MGPKVTLRKPSRIFSTKSRGSRLLYRHLQRALRGAVRDPWHISAVKLADTHSINSIQHGRPRQFCAKLNVCSQHVDSLRWTMSELSASITSSSVRAPSPPSLSPASAVPEVEGRTPSGVLSLPSCTSFSCVPPPVHKM